MAFDVAAESYDRFMGRYSVQLSPQLVALAGVEPGQRVIDVGSGPGALTAELVGLLGADSVVAVDPSEPFVEAARARYPGVDVRLAPAEDLPFPDDGFDAALAQLVVHFMADPVTGLAEMRRVTRPDGAVAACVWDIAGGRSPISVYWHASRVVDSKADDESRRAGTGQGSLTALFGKVGLRDVEELELTATVEYETFEEWWEPYTLGVGPAGAHAQSLSDADREKVRERCRELLPEPPFSATTYAWAARGLV